MPTLITETFYFQKLSIDFGKEMQDLIDYYKPIIETIEPNCTFTTLAVFPDKDFYPRTFKGVPVCSICAIISTPMSETQIHSDSSMTNPETGVNNSLALQIPIEGTEGTDTIFWSSFDESPTTMLTYKTSPSMYNQRCWQKENSFYYLPKRYTCTEVGRCTIDSPYLINVGEYHSVRNIKNTRRVTLSVRFIEDPWHWLG